MDFVLLGLCLFGFVKGYIKGFISMLFSLLGVVVVIFLAWKLTPIFSPFVYNLFGNSINTSIKSTLDNSIKGTFSDIGELVQVVGQSNLIINFVLSKLLGDISFDGNLSAGQILGEPLTNLAVKVISFVILSILMLLLLKIIQIIFTKMINCLGLKLGNHILGGVVGLAKGLLIFGILFFVLSLIANSTLNESLYNFTNSGQVANFVYENLIKKTINLFYLI